MTEAMPPTLVLSGDDEPKYVRALVGALRGARLNAHYPDPRVTGAFLRCLDPSVHKWLYDGVTVDTRSGLPAYKEWTRVQTDIRISGDQLHQLGDRASLARLADAHPGSIHAKQLAKVDYYRALQGITPAPLGDMTVSLRAYDAAKRRASYHVVLDKLDVSGMYVRFAIDLTEEAEARGDKVVRIDEEAARESAGFKALVYACTSFDAELTFVKLALIDGVEVERVVKGTVGPFFFPWSAGIPRDLASLAQGDGYVAMCSLDMVALDLAEDKDNDPYPTLGASRIAADDERTRATRASLGCRRFRDRKLVVPRRLVPLARQAATAKGTSTIVYGV